MILVSFYKIEKKISIPKRIFPKSLPYFYGDIVNNKNIPQKHNVFGVCIVNKSTFKQLRLA
jgi:hypothetical protein